MAAGRASYRDAGPQAMPYRPAVAAEGKRETGTILEIQLRVPFIAVPSGRCRRRMTGGMRSDGRARNRRATVGLTGAVFQPRI